MGVSLNKGQQISLTNQGGGGALVQVTVGMGWRERSTAGRDFDLDLSAFVLGVNDRVRSDDDFIFYNQPGNVHTTPPGATDPEPVIAQCWIYSTGDDVVGGGADDEDNEEIKVNLRNLPGDVHKIAFAGTIHSGGSRAQNFGMVDNAYIRVVNDQTGEEMVRFDLSEDMSTETAVVVAEIFRQNNEWFFKAITDRYPGGLGPMAVHYGVNVE
jgi:tellurium resistance protein TerD